MVVWKYPLELTQHHRIEMPDGARIVHVAEQGGVPTLWAEVEPALPLVPRTFLVVGTGHAFQPLNGSEHLGTAFCGPFVFHVYGSRAGRAQA